MFKSGSYLLCTLAVCLCLWKGSLAKDHSSGFVCLIDEPNPSECDSFCLNALQPILNQVDRRQDKMETQLKEVQDKLNEIQDKLEGSLLAALTKMENQLQEVLAMKDVPKADKVKVSEKDTYSIKRYCQKIGRAYFCSLDIKQDWATATKTCRQMRGQLPESIDLTVLHALGEEANRSYWVRYKNAYRRYLHMYNANPSDPDSECPILFEHKTIILANCKDNFNIICQVNDNF